MPYTRSVSICFFIGVGSRYETGPQAGISHFIEHLIFKGTPTLPTSKEISTAIEGVGGIINGSTDKELTAYWAKVARPHFNLALNVLVDIFRNSKLEPSEVERERQVIIEEINMIKDSPSQEVDTLIDELLWPGHPLGRDIAGTKESVSNISREMVVDYLNTHYLPQTTVVSIAGDIEHQEAVAVVQQALGDWKNQKPRSKFLPFKGASNPRLKIEERETEQAHLCLSLPGVSLVHPKRFTLDLLNVILGEGMSSRLFTEIRDKLGLAYSISSYADHFLDTGAVTVYAGVDPSNTKVALQAILEQLAYLRNPIPESEINKAKELVKGRLLLRMEDTRDVVGWIGGQEILMDRILSIDEIVARVDAITAEELSKMAEEIFKGNQLRLAIVGPVNEAESLENLLKL